MDLKQKVKHFLTDWTMTEIIAYVLITPIIVYMLFFGQNIAVDGQSMNPTFNNFDRLVASRSTKQLDKGDIVIVESSLLNERIIKRIIGESGDTIEMRNNRLFVNGEELQESYLTEEMIGNENFKVTVSDKAYWIMGDNRNKSGDSRMIGEVPIEEITGEVLFKYFSVNEIRGAIGFLTNKD